MASAKCRPFSLSLVVLMAVTWQTYSLQMPHYVAMFVFYVHWQASNMQISLHMLKNGKLQMASAAGVDFSIMLINELKIKTSLVFRSTYEHHDIKTLSASQALCPPVTGSFPHKGPVMRSVGVSQTSGWISCWTNSRVARNLRRHDAHVTSL